MNNIKTDSYYKEKILEDINKYLIIKLKIIIIKHLEFLDVFL